MIKSTCLPHGCGCGSPGINSKASVWSAGSLWGRDRSTTPDVVGLEGNASACMVPWYNVYIDAKGRVYPCCFLTATEHVMGNIFDAFFNEIWIGAGYREFRHWIANNRPGLRGCSTCPKNDRNILRRLRTCRILAVI